MILRRDLKADFPKLERYIRKEMPTLLHVTGVMSALTFITHGDETRQSLLATGLKSDLSPRVAIGDDSPTFYDPPMTILVRRPTAEGFEKRPHTLLGVWGKVYLAGIELLLGLIEWAFSDPTRPGPARVSSYDVYLQRAYGLRFAQVRDFRFTK